MRPAKERSMEMREGKGSGSGVLLLAAAALVGVAIAAEGAVARGLNGVGGVGWLVAAVLLTRSLLIERRRGFAVVAVVGVAAVLALVVRPSNLVAAIVGFFVAGALVALAGRDRPVHWALLVPALWLPLHLVIAVGRAIGDGGGRVRTDPPPTAALVPLAMVLAAAAGGWVVGRIARSRPSLVYPAIDAAAD